MKFRILLCVCIHFALFTVSTGSAKEKWDGRILDVVGGVTLTHDELTSVLKTYPLIVMGEVHYTKAVQNAEARLISETSKKSESNGHIGLGWEFLDAVDQPNINAQFDRFKKGEITSQELLVRLQKNETASPYSPVMESLKTHSGWLFGVNLSRDVKAKVVKGGLKNAPAGSIPQGFELGGTDYFERFKEAMGGHGPGDLLQNYFEAQCLTDDVMAVNLLNVKALLHQLFFIVGAFHTDYFDGVVKRLYKRGNGLASVTVRFIDTSEYSESELVAAVKHEKYGEISDFVIFLNEPKGP